MFVHVTDATAAEVEMTDGSPEIQVIHAQAEFAVSNANPINNTNIITNNTNNANTSGGSIQAKRKDTPRCVPRRIKPTYVINTY
jgi:hypothetical protein